MSELAYSTAAFPLNRIGEIVAEMEKSAEPVEEHSLRSPFVRLSKEIQESSGEVPLSLAAEVIAFSLHAHDHQEDSSWGLYFGPMMSWPTKDGGTIDEPALDSIGPDVLACWRQRADETTHPVLRARYCDLLWEIPKRVAGSRPDAEMARRAVDAYLEAVANRLYKHETSYAAKTGRALSIAIQISDTERILHSRDALVALEEAPVDDDLLGLWGFSFDTLVEPPNPNVPVPPELRDKIVALMEARLARVAVREGDGYHPSAVENAALRLATHYRRRGLRSEVERVMRLYISAVLRMPHSAAAILRSSSLEKLYDQLVSFQMRADASSLDDAIRRAGEDSMKEMKPISVAVDVETDKIEAYFASLLSGDSQTILVRVAFHFIPRRAELEEQMRALAEAAPLASMLHRIIKDDEGRTVARVGPIADDLEGSLISHIAQVMHLSAPWLNESFDRAGKLGAFNFQAVLDFVVACPLFVPARYALLEAGLRAYFAGDLVSAIHILVPQVEQCVRQLGSAIGAPIYSRRRGGGLNLRTLDDLLRDTAVAGALGEDVAIYLRVILTDARGWNIRNRVAHGLAPSSAFGVDVADRIVHATMTLALLRLQEEEQSTRLAAAAPSSDTVTA